MLKLRVIEDGAVKLGIADEGVISLSIGEATAVKSYEDYKGAYEVTSFCAEPLLTTSLVLPTNDKHMTDDMTIYSVPTREEYNSAGGVTFMIGGGG